MLLQLRRSNRARARSKAARLPAAPAGTLSVITRQYHMLPKIPTGVAGTFADGQQMFSGVAAALGESQLWQRSPPIVTTTVLATTAIMSFMVAVVQPMLSVVAFVPAHTYGSHAYFWNLVTYSFVETNILLFAIDAAFIFTFLPIFERMWGAAETACFFLACVASAALLLLISLIACFAVTLEWKVLQSINVGLSSAVCAVLVFIAQIYPSDRVLGITGKNVPWAYAGVCCILRIISGGIFEALLVVYGGVAGWIYLRFIQVRGDYIVRGDASEEFSAASFFGWAPPLRALVQLLSPAAHRMCCCCMPLAATSLLPGRTPAAAEPLPAAVQAGVGVRMPEVSVSQAQRYRQRALLALSSYTTAGVAASRDEEAADSKTAENEP